MFCRLDAFQTDRVRNAIVLAALVGTCLPASALVTQWQELDPGIPAATHLNGIWAAAPDNVYIVGSGGAIWRYDGTAWPSQTSHVVQELYGIWGTAANNIYAVGSGGAIVHYNGTAWSTMVSHTTSDLRRIWGSSASDIWAVGLSSTFLHFDGTNWTNLNIGLANDVYGVWGTAANNVYAVDNAGRVLHYNGTNWSSIHSEAHTDLWGIWGADNNSVFAVGRDTSTDLCQVLHYDGSNWSPMATNTARDLYDVWGSGPDDVYAVGADAAGAGTIIMHYNGTAWSVMTSPSAGAMNAVAGSGPDDVYACSYTGATLYRGTQHSAGSVQFDSATYSVDRFASFLTVSVTRSGGEDAQASVVYATSNGTAAAGTDYTAASGTLTFEPGQTSQTFDVTILGSAGGRTFDLTLSNPGSGTALGTPHTAVVTIVDNGPAPALSLQSLTVSINVLPFRVGLSRGVDWPVIVDFATQDGTAVAGVNYTQAGDTIIIQPGETSATINVDLIGNVEAASGKTISVVLSNPIGATLDTAQATGTIQASTSGGGIRCGSGVGAGNLITFYALCWTGLVLIKSTRRIARGRTEP